MKQSVNITLNETSNLFQECNVELQRRVERLERYSRDFNIRVIGVAEQDGEDCLLIRGSIIVGRTFRKPPYFVPSKLQTAFVFF